MNGQLLCPGCGWNQLDALAGNALGCRRCRLVFPNPYAAHPDIAVRGASPTHHQYAAQFVVPNEPAPNISSQEPRSNLPSRACASCGASGCGFVCEYCGTCLLGEVEPAQELSVLDEFHRMLTAIPEERRVAFLQNGYMPKSEAALMEAGLRCIGSLDPWENSSVSAAQRIESIASRLRVVSGSKQSQEAVRQLDEAVRKFRTRRVKMWVALAGFALVFFSLLLFASCAVRH